MPTDLLEKQQLPRSTVRHRPIASDAINTQGRTPRPSRGRRHHEPHTTGGPPSALSVDTSNARGTWLIYLVLGMLCACVLLWIGQFLWNYATTVSEDLRYGRPRTTNVDHMVGHEHGSIPTHFTALNLNGQVYIIEIPGGQADHSHILVGPRLYGPGSDLAPVTLSFIGDAHHPDLVASIENIQVHFRNTGTTFVPAS